MKSEELDRLERLAHSSGIRVAIVIAYQNGRADALMESFRDIIVAKERPLLIEGLTAQVAEAERKAEQQ